MANKSNCDSIFLDYIFKVPKYDEYSGLRSGIDKSGRPYYSFDYYFYESTGINKLYYLKVNLVCRKKLDVEPNDLVQITKIIGLRAKNLYNKHTGVRDTYLSLIVELKKVDKYADKLKADTTAKGDDYDEEDNY